MSWCLIFRFVSAQLRAYFNLLVPALAIERKERENANLPGRGLIVLSVHFAGVPVHYARAFIVCCTY